MILHQPLLGRAAPDLAYQVCDTDADPERTWPERPAWQHRGACVGMASAVFFPGQHAGAAVTAAKAICAGCPVRAECLQYALDNVIQHGVYGGTSERQRRAMRNPKAAA